MLVKFITLIKMQRWNICESWHINRGRVPKDYLLYLQGYSFPKRNCKKLSNPNLRQLQFAVQEEHRYIYLGAMHWWNSKRKQDLAEYPHVVEDLRIKNEAINPNI